jgi:hypothetical protein
MILFYAPPAARASPPPHHQDSHRETEADEEREKREREKVFSEVRSSLDFVTVVVTDRRRWSCRVVL